MIALSGTFKARESCDQTRSMIALTVCSQPESALVMMKIVSLRREAIPT